MKQYLDLKEEIFRWGPIPGRYFYTADFMVSLFSEILEKFPKSSWPKTLILFVDGQLVWINEFDDLRNEGRKAFNAYMMDATKRKEIRSTWDEAIKALQAYERKILEADLEKLNEEDFKKNCIEFRERIVDFWTYSIPTELGNYGVDKILEEEIAPYVPRKDFARVLEILTAPEAISFYQEEEIDLAETNNLAEHQKKYFWLKNSYAEVQVLEKNFFEKRKKDIDPNIRKQIQETLREAKEEKREVKEEYKLPDKVLQIAHIICDGIAWQDERKKHIFQLLHYKEFVLREYARRTKQTEDDARNLGLHEFYHEPKEKRTKGFGFYFQTGANECEIEFTEKQVKDLWKVYTYEKVSEDAESVTGIIAQPGKVKGNVCIVTDPRKAKHFKEGDILVAPMTSPDYIFLMKKASAIVTNAGGLTSHAAIVARELKTPCIVGTKAATQVFKNGDNIEVDANNGIVKKL